MNKKLLSILFTLFLAGILSVSCSNKDKTGSGGNAKIDSKYAVLGFIQTAAVQHLLLTVTEV